MAKVHFHGHLGKDAKVIEGQKGKFGSASIGERVGKDQTQWWGLLFNNPQHIALIEKGSLKKGSYILVDGTLKMRTYKDKNGDDQTALDVWVDSFDYLGGNSGSTESNKVEVKEDDAQKEIAKAMAASKAAKNNEEEEEELPF